MPGPSRSHLPLGSIALVIAIVVCAVITVVAMLQAPDSPALGRRHIGDGLVLTIAPERSPCSYWRAHISASKALRPLPAWTLDVMSDDQAFCRLHWQPQAVQLELQVAVPNAASAETGQYTAQSEADSLPLSVTVAQLQLERVPEQVWLVRQGHRLLIQVDGAIAYDAVVPMLSRANTRWRVLPESDLKGSRATIHLDRHLERAAINYEDTGVLLDRDRAEQLTASACQQLQPGHPSWQRAVTAAKLLGQAGDDLRLWLAWHHLRSEMISHPNQVPAGDNGAEWERQLTVLIASLAAQPTGPLPTNRQLSNDTNLVTQLGADDTADENLSLPASGTSTPVNTGISNLATTSQALLDSLLPLVTKQVTTAPAAGLSIDEWLHQRRWWLKQLRVVAIAIAGSDDDLDRDPYAALTGHVATRLLGIRTMPVPAKAPAWLAERWRLAAGTNLADFEQVTPLPPTTPGYLHSLLAYAELTDSDAVLACSLARLAINGQPEAAETALERSSGRQRWLLHGLLATANAVPAAEARQALRDDRIGLPPLESDPLAWAIDRVLATRGGARSSNPDVVLSATDEARTTASTSDPDQSITTPNPDSTVTDMPPSATTAPGSTPVQIPASLQRYARLLDGRPGSSLLVTSLSDDRLPPLQALAAALACIQAAGGTPDWTWLQANPSLTIPVELLIPSKPD